MKLLAGKRVLVTRPRAQQQSLAELIEAQGGEAICFPLLEIAPVSPGNWLPLVQRHWSDCTLVIFISPNAVEASVPHLHGQQLSLSGKTVAAIGPGTVTKLAQFYVHNVVLPSGRFDSEALLEQAALQEACVAGKGVMVFRGNGGRDLLGDTLTARGARVTYVSCYERSAPVDASFLTALFEDGRLDAVTISSSEALRNLMGLLSPELIARVRAMPLFVPHQRIAKVASDLGFLHVVLTDPADAGIINGLSRFEWRDNDE